MPLISHFGFSYHVYTFFFFFSVYYLTESAFSHFLSSFRKDKDASTITQRAWRLVRVLHELVMPMPPPPLYDSHFSVICVPTNTTRRKRVRYERVSMEYKYHGYTCTTVTRIYCVNYAAFFFQRLPHHFGTEKKNQWKNVNRSFLSVLYYEYAWEITTIERAYQWRTRERNYLANAYTYSIILYGAHFNRIQKLTFQLFGYFLRRIQPMLKTNDEAKYYNNVFVDAQIDEVESNV